MANYKKIMPFVRKWEGGLSNNKSDNASKNPSPCEYNGKKGWHTNKGVTWTTFKGSANLGYTANHIVVKAIFYDKNGKYLDSDYDNIYDLPHTYQENFTIIITDYSFDYFENVNYVKFDFYES